MTFFYYNRGVIILPKGEQNMWYGISSLRPFEQYALFGVLAIAIAGLLYALFLRRQVMREDAGTAKMQEVWGAIREGANAIMRCYIGSKRNLYMIERDGE